MNKELLIKARLEKGLTSDGLPAHVYALYNHQGMSISIMDIGATWVSCIIPVADKIGSPSRDVLLGMLSIDDYSHHSAFLGATIGRFANRIKHGKFVLNNQQYQLSLNDGKHCLHGGGDGFDKRRWALAAQSENNVVLRLESKDGDQGFPGNIIIEVAYTLTEENQVCIEYFALCDQDCPINLTNHAYFNLDGADSDQSVLDHKLWIKSPSYVVTDETLIPTGELKSVNNTSFDFNQHQTIGSRFLTDDEQRQAKGYDHTFTFYEEDCDGLTSVAELISSDDKVKMLVLTNKPAVQLYTGNYLAGTPSRTGKYKDYQGVALETQFYPDAPNQNWPGENKAYVAKKSFYQYQTTYQFEF